jgi:hypothetical protein
VSKRDIFHKCPYCGEWHDAVAVMDDKQPRKIRTGDFSFCIDCGEFAVFDHAADGLTRKPTVLETVEIVNDASMQTLKAAWKMTITEEGK